MYCLKIYATRLYFYDRMNKLKQNGVAERTNPKRALVLYT